MQSYSLQRIPSPSRGIPSLAFTFPTTWPLTQNPVSLGSPTQGLDVGLDWQNTQSTGGNPGISWGTGDSGAGGFNDNICTWQNSGVSTTKHFVEIDLHLFAGYQPPDSHETELLGGFTITAHSAKGYEATCPLGLSGAPGPVDMVRWNGALGDFTTSVFTTLSGASWTPASNGRIKMIFDATSGSPIITLFEGGVQKWQVTDTTAGKITSGFPGEGFFARPGAGGLDLSKWCNERLNLGNA